MKSKPAISKSLIVFALLSAALAGATPFCRAQTTPPVFDGWTPPATGSNALGLNSTLTGSFSVKGPAAGSSSTEAWRVLLEGFDIYGNSVSLPLDTGTIDPLLGGSNAQTATINFSGVIPNDGTLHRVTGSGYSLKLYFGTSVTAISAGALKAGQSGYFVEVTPDLLIPGVQQVTKIRATATATITTGGVTALAVVNPGQGYDPFKPPSVTFTSATGTGAAATAVVDPETGSILSFKITSAGSGYTAAPTVSVANPPTTQTQRTGGVLYGYNEQTGLFNYTFNSGDAVRFQTTIRNNNVGSGNTLQSRPMRTSIEDEFRLRTVLTVDPAYTAAAGDDDQLVFDQTCFGDMAAYPADLTQIRTIRTYRTPAAVPTYGVLATTNATPPTLAAVLTNGRVGSITIVASNSAVYDPFNPPPVLVGTNGGGTGATAVAQLSIAGKVTNIAVISGGLGYTSPPTMTIPVPAYGARYYQPMPDDGFLDIGEEVQLGYDVLMPQRYPGIFYVAAKVDALNQIDEPTGFSPGRESPPRDTNALVNNNTFISDVATRVQILSGPGPGLAPVSQVTDPSGAPLIQSDGYSDIASVSQDGGYVAFESYARDLAVSQSLASSSIGPVLTNFPPLWSQLGTDIQGNLASGLANGHKQILRRNTSTKQAEIISVSSSGEQANSDAQNASMSSDGQQIAFESRAANLVANDTGGASDVFVRRLDLLKTTRISVNKSGIQGNAGSFAPSISGDGRYIAFESIATNLDPANPVPAGSSAQQVFVHDRDVSGSGNFDSPGNTATYMVSVTSVGASQATATASVSGGKVLSCAVTGPGAGYLPAFPPAVIITGGGGSGAKATAVVSPSGIVASIVISDAGSGYTSAPTVTIAPRATASDGWSNQAKISEDGKYLTFVSYSSNLPKNAGGPAIGNTGYQGVVYRVALFQGMPVVNSMQAVSVDTSGNLATALSYEPAINGDGSQIAFTSLADNLVVDDTNAFADIFVRDFTNNKTIRVSESLNRFAIGSIQFTATPTIPQSPPVNNPRNGDQITLSDGVNTQTLTFTDSPALATEVQIGATASASRDNLVRSINALQAAGSLNMIAVADSPASANTYYPPTSRIPGQANSPGLFLLASVPGTAANVEIGGNFTIINSIAGVNSGLFPGGNALQTTGMRLGGTQADDDAGEFDGVPAGSTMPSIDRSGMVVAFRSTMQTLDVFNRTYTGHNGLRPGDIIRALRNASANVYVRARDVDGEGSKLPDALDNVNTVRTSVNRFGNATYSLINTPSAANSHKPAVSALGRYIAFSSDAENEGGLAFGRSNLDPQDNNGYRDIYLYDRDVTAEPPIIITNNSPSVILTDPSWLSGRQLSVGSYITVNALVTDVDEELDLQNVTFFVNGAQYTATGRYGNYYSATVKVDSISSSNIIQVRARDNSGASNDATTSAPITFASVASIPYPTSITMLSLPRGTILEVGQPVELRARATFPLAADLYGAAYVRFYANGVLIGSTQLTAGSNSADATFTWYPEVSGPVLLQAVASTVDFFFATSNPRTWATLYSNQLPSVSVLAPGDASAPPGTPGQVVYSLFQTVLSRPPTAIENSYWVSALSTGVVSPAGMVLQLVSETEYNDLQNILFGYYYRLNTAPSSATYLTYLSIMETKTSVLPDAGQPPAGNGSVPSPYGATVGDAQAAQSIISSAAFATANPGIQTSTDNSFLTWYYGRCGSQPGNPIGVLEAMGTYTPSAERKGFATALIAAQLEAGFDQSAFNVQLKATSLKWLFTGVWSAPTSPTVTTQAQLNAFVTDLVTSSLGVPTWTWVYANGLTGSSAAADANPAGDGINNLQKYAFNMNPKVAYNSTNREMTPTGVSGLPLVNTVSSGGLNYLQITYVRRVNEASVSYTPQFSSSLIDPLGWENANVASQVTPIDAVWERVTVRDSLPQGTVPARFGRVQVTTSFWIP